MRRRGMEAGMEKGLSIYRAFGLYTGGFLGFIALMAILEQFGVPADVLGILSYSPLSFMRPLAGYRAPCRLTLIIAGRSATAL